MKYRKFPAILAALIMLPSIPVSAEAAEYVTLVGEDIGRLRSVCGRVEILRKYDHLGGYEVRVPVYSRLAAKNAGFCEASEFSLPEEVKPAEAAGNGLSLKSDGVIIPIGTVTTDNEESEKNAGLEPDDYTLDELAYDYEFKGEGICIAVIDTGFFTEHESFVLSGEGRLSKEYVDSLTLIAGSADESEAADGDAKTDLEKESYYLNPKIPFAYNYAAKNGDVSGLPSHGTAVVSAAAGNNIADTEHPSGAAPEAQVLLMKVFSDETARASEGDILAAVNDALTLAADVICISFGEACGFNYTGSTFSIESALEAAEAAGVIVVSAAGDSTKLGEVSPYNKYAGIIAPTTDNPDVGTISYPGSSDRVVAVGSAQSNVYSTDCFIVNGTDGETVRIPYSDTNTLWQLPTGGLSFAKFFDGQSLEYEFVPRYGREEDFSGLDLTGKIAVIERGVIAFNEKCKSAAAHGAIGVVIYDNQPDPDTVLDVRMDISESPIPAVIISGVSADKLRTLPDRQIRVADGERYISLRRETPTPSSYSAWGATPELLLKPDFSVVGELIECASADGAYMTTGGTTISAAKSAGMLACVKEKLMKDGLSSKEAAGKAVNLLCSSAQLMTRNDGNVFSPRVQGSGAAALGRALSAGIMITSDGGHRIELGELEKYWFTLDVTVTNLTDSDKVCEIDAVIGSDGYQDFIFSDLDSSEAGKDKLSEKLGKNPWDAVNFTDQFTPFTKARIFPGYANMNINSNAEGYEPIRYTLKAGKTATFRLTVLLDSDTIGEYEKIFENGYFIEGYIRARADGEEASIPFMGFKGDWHKKDAADTELYSGIEAAADPVYLYREYNSELVSGRLILGADPFSGRDIDRSMLCLSPIADAAEADVYLNFGILRNVTDVKVRVSSGGELISETEYGNLARTHIDYASGMTVSPQLKLWDGRAADNRYYIYPDGEYLVEVSYRVNGGGRERVLSYPIYLDSTAPSIDGYEFSVGDDGMPRMTAEVSDNFSVSKCSVYDEYTIEAAFDGEYYDLSMLGRYIYIEVFDRAMNSTVTRISNPYFGTN